jgi:hypothetical protein
MRITPSADPDNSSARQFNSESNAMQEGRIYVGRSAAKFEDMHVHRQDNEEGDKGNDENQKGPTCGPFPHVAGWVTNFALLRDIPKH